MTSDPRVTPPLLAVSGLSVAFGAAGRPVVNDVTFEVGARETVAIVGESGSGKSVTAMAILRLLPPGRARVSGRIALDGRDLVDLDEEAMRRVRGADVAMIFQEPMTSLNPVLTVGDQVAEALVHHDGLSWSAARAEALRLFDRVRIPAAARRFHDHPHHFSGGMRQRVMIAMALACRPKLLVADEPTTALDVTIQDQILSLLRALRDEEGMAVLFITHDMGVVAEIADRTLVMKSGRLVEDATTDELFARPRHPYTRTLLAAVPGRIGSETVRPAPATAAAAVGSEAPVLPTAVPSGPVLSVRGLTTRFDVRSGFLGRVRGRIHAVENVSFDLGRGEVLSIVGESGCGKSTTGRSILRLIEPTAGSVRLEGEEVLTMSAERLRVARRRMQMVFQDPFGSLNPRLRVGEAIAEPIVAHRLAEPAEAHDRVRELLRRVGLSPDMASRHPHEFSGGQRQRLCIARALALDPAVLIADEAVSALDVSVKAAVVDLLRELRDATGVSLLFISHDIAVVERISHRIAVMYMGEIVEIGPAAAVTGDPRHPYTRRLMAAVPIADPRRRRRRDVDPSNEEIVSPIRPLGWASPAGPLVEVAPGHLVRVPVDAEADADAVAAVAAR